MFANPEAIPSLRGFEAIDDELFPVHATLRLVLRGDGAMRNRCAVKKPVSMAQALQGQAKSFQTTLMSKASYVLLSSNTYNRITNNWIYNLQAGRTTYNDNLQPTT